MGMRSRLGLEGKTPLKVIANLGATIKRAANVFLPASRESISIDMLSSHFLPYEASKTYRTIKAESDCRLAQAIVEAQRSLRRV